MALFPPTSPNWQTDVSPLEVLITRACNPSMHEPNYGLHMQVAEHINQKKANTPREAAMFTARLVNHRNPHIAMLALALLETLVQSCGYPFHLQIATKEFLNELVRRFPERPPPFPGPVMSRILELIHDWKESICTESRWKEDLGNIRDMHRLLTFKGYRFRDLPRRPAAAAAVSTANLKSAEELENEDREAQSAKLQELIRRGTPRDLAAAQELMKTLAGANPEAKPDYRTQALNELNKLESKVILLNEMLDNVDSTNRERFVQGDAYDQVATILSSARPKIQGWISNAEETDDPESLDTFLQINDQINTVLGRYDAFKRGDYAAAANPIPSELGVARGGGGVSLIDFDDSGAQDSSTAGATTGTGTGLDELASVFGPGAVAPALASTSAGAGAGRDAHISSILRAMAQGGPTNAPLPSFSSAPQGAGSSVGIGVGMGVGAGAGAGAFGRGFSFSAQSSAASPSPSPNANASVGVGVGVGAQHTGTTGMIRLGSPAVGGHSTPSPFAGVNPGPSPLGQQQPSASSAFLSQQQQQQQQQQQRPPQPPQTPQQQQGKDPFADLVGLF